MRLCIACSLLWLYVSTHPIVLHTRKSEENHAKSLRRASRD